ncbi:carbohydrate ABC transporter permease [Microbacterium sp. NPDC055683]
MSRIPQERSLLLLAVPGAGGAVLFIAAPLVFALWLSTREWDLIGSPEPVGLQNFADALGDGRFGGALVVTLAISMLAVPGVILVSVVIARAARTAPRAARVSLPALAVPWLISPLAAGTVWRWILAPEDGGISGIVGHRIEFLTRPVVVPIAIAVLLVWSSAAPSVLLLLAAWRAIPGSVLEAAQLDGAGWIRRLTAVELPLMRGTVGLIGVGMLAQVFALFDQSYALAGTGSAAGFGGAGLLVYETAFRRFDFGRAAAMSLALALVQAALVAACGLLRGPRT